MNINPFRLTAGAYLLSKDMRDKKRERDRERKEREKQERFFILKKRENRAIVWMSFSLTAEISIRYNDINLFFFSHPSSWSPQRMQKRSSSTFYLSLYRYAPLKIALEKNKKQNGYQNRWKSRVHKSRWLYWVPLQNMFGLRSNIKELPKSQ